MPVEGGDTDGSERRGGPVVGAPHLFGSQSRVQLEGVRHAGRVEHAAPLGQQPLHLQHACRVQQHPVVGLG